MIGVYIYAITSAIVVSLVSLIGIFTFYFNTAKLKRFTFLAIGLAGGAMFGNALIHLLPEANEIIGSNWAAALALLGVLLFFVLEKVLHWHHHGHFNEAEHTHAEMHRHPLGYLVLTSDVLHNFIDGVVIGAAYLISVEVGIAVTVAVMLHEIPQELSDYGLLLHSGFTKVQALAANFASAITAVFGVLLVLSLGSNEMMIGGISAVAAGMFLYIAGSDLVPELHKTLRLRDTLVQLLMMVLGMGAMFALLLIE